MLQKLSTAFGIILLASSFAFAGQSTTPAPSSAKPATTAGVQQSPASVPVKTHKKHHKGQKKQTKQATSSTQPKQ